jgi:hypothetical protein
LIAWIAAALAMLAALLAPAFWNGFPIVYHDTGGYLERPFEGTLAMGRSALYGSFLALGIPSDFWLNVIAQAALTAWLIVLVLRVHGLGGRPGLAAALVIALTAFTGLPWYAAELIPDILVPAAVIALHLLAFEGARLRRWETWLLVVVVALAIACHMAILALALGLLTLFALVRVAGPRLPASLAPPRPSLIAPAIAVAAGMLLAPFSNFLVAGRFAFTPGGSNFVFARLLQDGIVSRYLADRCPDPDLARDVPSLCDYQDYIATHKANDWLWDEESPVFKLGGYDAFAADAQRVALATLFAYPGLHAQTAVTATLEQFASFTTGDEIVPWTWHSRWNIERFAPAALPHFLASRQQGPVDLSMLNAFQVPVTALAIAALPFVLLAAVRRRVGEPAATFAFTVLVALAGNAVICGVLSNPQNRYQGRLVWLAVLAIAVAGLAWRRRVLPQPT